MEFLGIHELSVEFDIPARVLRYRFLQLIQSGKLTEGADCRRDDFIDDQHFVWKINPVSFMRETGYQLVNKSSSFVTKDGNQSETIGIRQDNKVVEPVIKTVTWGKTYADAVANAKEAIEGFIEFLKKTGRPVPVLRRNYQKVHIVVRLPAQARHFAGCTNFANVVNSDHA